MEATLNEFIELMNRKRRLDAKVIRAREKYGLNSRVTGRYVRKTDHWHREHGKPKYLNCRTTLEANWKAIFICSRYKVNRSLKGKKFATWLRNKRRYR